MAENITVMGDVIDPEVLGDVVAAKLDTKLQHIQYAKVDNTLVGRPGDTLTAAKYGYIGPAEVRGELEEADVRNLNQESTTYTIKKLIVSVGISEEAKISGHGKPADHIEKQLRMSIEDRINLELVDAAFKTPQILFETPSATISYDGIAKCATEFKDESDEVKKVMFINPAQEYDLITDTDIKEHMKFNGDVAQNGYVGTVCGIKIKKSANIPLINCEHVASGTSGAVKVTAENLKTNKYKYWDPDGKCVVVPAIDSYVKALAVPYYKNQIIKLEPDDDSTEYTENEFAALTIFKKQEVKVNYKYEDLKTYHRFTAHTFAGFALTNEEKVLVANFQAKKTS